MFCKVTMIGRISSDFNLLGGNAGCKFSVAHNSTQKDESGKYVTQFVDCVVFGELSNLVKEYCKKGDLIYIEGNLNINAYNDNQGVKRKSTSIILSMFRNLQPKPQGQVQGQYNQVNAGDYPKNKQYATQAQDKQSKGNDDVFYDNTDNSMPF